MNQLAWPSRHPALGVYGRVLVGLESEQMQQYGGAENSTRAERFLRRTVIMDRWWINYMNAVKKRSEQLQKDINSEGSS